MKKRHPAEIAAEADMIEAIRGADHFLASLFIGHGEYKKAKAATVYAAEIAAADLESNYSKHTRRCILYAVGKDGRATMITRDLIDRLKQATKGAQQ